MRLIDADALFNDLKASAKDAREWRDETQDEEIKIRAEQAHGTFIECALRVKNAPTIEPEVRHGRWKKKNGEIYCTNCKKSKWSESFELMLRRFNYCPHCGARMDGQKVRGE